jgi:tetratricopeptide (TPR) repeat protein
VEWELRMGNSDNAIALYEKLVDKVNEKNKLLERAWKNISIYNEDKMRDSEITDVKTLLTKVEERLSKEEQGLLEVVNRLINEESFSEAKMLLFKWRMRADENFENEIIERALKIVDRAESGNLANGKNDYETTAMNDAQRLIEEEKYDEAIYLLESVSFDSGSIKGRALEMKEMAVEKLINKEHHKAAETFLMAKKSSDPAEKQSLLESSFKILNNLVEKYPSSPLINKINSHIERVKNELETMGR